MASCHDIDGYLNVALDVAGYRDYGPNGLQVEGRREVRRLVSGVTASLALIDAAIACDADAMLVHHGLFWRGQDGRLTGWLGERVRRLMKHDIGLFAYHLPLDAHPEWGNNAQFGSRLGLRADARFGDQNIGFIGTSSAEGASVLALDALICRVEATLHRSPTVIQGDGRPIRRVAWCTGGAQGSFEDAVRAGADVYLTGEISEPQAHLARETGVAYIACGHHATERFGAPALGAHIAQRFSLEHSFVEVENPA